MAFSYRNPIEAAINQLPSKFSDQALCSTSDSIISRLDDLNSYFSFSMKKEVEELLISNGVELAPISFKAHSHPACKTIENHIIYRVVPMLFSKIPSISFISMREEKVEKFLRVRNFSRFGVIKALKPLNMILDSKDSFRYMSSENLSHSHGEMVLKLRNECLENGWFPKVVFIHDELHFWDAEKLLNFFDTIPEIKNLVGTVVCPPELLFGETVSKNPRIYTFEVDGDDLFFFPDGVGSEGYTQSVKTSTWWLKTSCVSRGSTFLRISIIYSLYSHHLVSIDRGTMLQKNYFFNKPDCLLDTELEQLSGSLSGGLIERSTISSILTYLSCLKSPNRESALAKLRQLEKRDLFPDEAFLVSSISSTFIKYGIGKEIDEGFFERVTNGIYDLMPHFLQDFVDKKKHWHRIFRDFLKKIATKNLRIERTELLLDSVDELDDDFVCFEDRTPAPYSYRRLGVRNLPFPLCIFQNCLVSDTNCVSCPSTVINRVNVSSGRVQPTDLARRPVLRICYEVDKQIENNSKVDTFSSKGLVISPEIEICPFEKSSISYGQRKNCCVFDSIAVFVDEEPEDLINTVFNADISGDLFDCIEDDKPLTLELIQEVCLALDVCCYIQIGMNVRKFNLNGRRQAFLHLEKGHATPMDRRKFSEIVSQGEMKKISLENKKGIKFPEVNSGHFQFNAFKAQKLMKSFRRGSTGIMNEINPKVSEDLSKILDEAAPMLKDFSKQKIPFSLCLGVPGSGKSTNIGKWLNENPTFQCLIVSPRRALAEEWSEKLKGTIHKVCTFESALATQIRTFRGIVFDEISLYPPGFMHLLLLFITLRSNNLISSDMLKGNKFKAMLSEGSLEIPQLFFLGDSLQTFYYSSLDSLLLDKEFDLNELISSVGGDLEYLWYSYRLPKKFSKILDFQCLGGDELEDFKIYSEFSACTSRDYDAILVPSHEDKRNLQAPMLCLTFGESQGLTFEKKVLICISSDFPVTSEQSLIVALTRSKKGFDFFFMAGRTYEDMKLVLKKKMAGYILGREQIKKERLMNLIPSKKCKPLYLSGGIFEKAQNDLFILPEVQIDYPVPDEEEEEIANSGPVWLKTHIPIATVNPLLAETFEKMRAKEKREFFHSSRGFSEQFPDTDKGLVEDVMGYSFRFDSIFPRHHGTDDVTFWEGVKKRLSFSNPRAERKKFEDARLISDKLLKVFISKMPGEFKVSRADVENGLNSFNQKRAEKTEALWKAHSERSDIDWPLNHIFLFMKSQLCTKQEKMFTDAKAGQTLACFHHTILFRFGPYLRAIEKAFMRACGESYYIHSGKNFNSLNEFVLKNSSLFQGESVESDYEAFDSSQDAVILAFEEKLLIHLGLSDSFIKDYIYLKLNLGCRLGSLAIMRFTGEFCTFLFNTFANMLFTFLKYDIEPRKDRLLFAGDDMASIGKLRKAGAENQKLLGLFSLKAKEFIKPIPTFCGWHLSPEGIIKSPKLLWARICLMKQRGMISNCLDSYFLESVFAYNLGEKLFSFFDETEIEYHYVVSRFFIQNHFRFSGEAKSIFFGYQSSFGSKCQLLKSMTSPSEQRKKTSKLMLSNLLTYMGTLASSDPRSFRPYADLKAILKLAIVVMGELRFRTFLYWIKSKLTLSKNSLPSFRTSILAPYLSASHLLYQISGNSKGKLCCMMTPLLNLSQALSQLMKSISRRGQPFLSLGQNTCFQQMTLSCQTRSKLSLKLMGSLSNKTEKSLGLMWAVYTVCQIRLASFVAQVLRMLGHNKRFGAATSYPFQMSSENVLNLFPMSLNWMCMIWMSSSKTEDPFFLLGKLAEKGSYLGLEGQVMRFFQGYLSQPHYDLIKYYRRKKEMSSVQDVIQSTIRQATNQWLWDNYVDPNHQIMAANVQLDAVPENLVNPVTAALIHYKIHLFGNIAILGSSGKTQWPNVDIALPRLQIVVGQEQVNKNYTLNLSTVLPLLEMYRASSQNHSFKTATFRQVCECFASEAYMFLKRHYPEGVSTNIYKKWPKALESAPWVAFDFCTGLKMCDLTPDEKKVIDRLTKRLFRTEGQKGIFEAGQEVNVDLEG